MPWFLLCISRTFWTISFCTRRLRCFLALASIIRPSLTLMLLKWSLPFFLRSSKTSQCFLPLLLLSDGDSPLSTSTCHSRSTSGPGPIKSSSSNPQYHLSCHHYLSLYQKFYSNNQLTATIILSWSRRLIWLPTATGASGTLLLYTCNSQTTTHKLLAENEYLKDKLHLRYHRWLYTRFVNVASILGRCTGSTCPQSAWLSKQVQQDT